MDRFGRYVLLTPARVDAAEGFFTRHGGKVVVVARFIDGLRQANGIVAGITGMAWRRFLAFNAIGAALWVGLWAGLGYLAGTNIGPVYDQVRRYELYLLVVVVVLVVALITRGLWRRRHSPRSHEDHRPSENAAGDPDYDADDNRDNPNGTAGTDGTGGTNRTGDET